MLSPYEPFLLKMIAKVDSLCNLRVLIHSGCGWQGEPRAVAGLAERKGVQLWTECSWSKEQETPQQIRIQQLSANSKSVFRTRGNFSIMIFLPHLSPSCFTTAGKGEA